MTSSLNFIGSVDAPGKDKGHKKAIFLFLDQFLIIDLSEIRSTFSGYQSSSMARLVFSKCDFKPEASIENLLEMQVLRFYSRPTESETFRMEPSNLHSNTPSR